jgi:hypothetical protein
MRSESRRGVRGGRGLEFGLERRGVVVERWAAWMRGRGVSRRMEERTRIMGRLGL